MGNPVLGFTSPSLSETIITAKILIEEIENLTGGDFDFNNIPSGYDRFIVEGIVESDIASNIDAAWLFLNEDLTSTAYHVQQLYGFNGVTAVGEAAQPLIGFVPGSTSTSSGGYIKVRIEEPSSAVAKIADTRFAGPLQSATDVINGIMAILSPTTAAVTRIRVRTDNHSTDQLVGKLKLYGEKEATIQSLVKTGKVALQTITNTVAGEFDFNNIPSGYKRLIIQGTIRGDVASADDTLYCFLNGDTTVSNYHSQLRYAAAGVASNAEDNTARVAYFSSGSAPADSYTRITLIIEDYEGANLKAIDSDYRYYYGTDNALVGAGVVTSVLTAAVTRIRLQTDNDPTDEIFGTLTLYGEN